jgi:3-mercaptopyruvate sulfurtransferase SseA
VPWLSLYETNTLSGSQKARRNALKSEEPVQFLTVEELRVLFEKAGVKEGKQVVTYCGAGYAARMAFKLYANIQPHTIFRSVET